MRRFMLVSSIPYRHPFTQRTTVNKSILSHFLLHSRFSYLVYFLPNFLLLTSQSPFCQTKCFLSYPVHAFVPFMKSFPYNLRHFPATPPQTFYFNTMEKRGTVLNCLASASALALGATLGYCVRIRRRPPPPPPQPPPPSIDFISSALVCPMCKTECGRDLSPRMLSCGHTFCESCLSALFWLTPHPLCPVCQRKVRGPLAEVPFNHMVCNLVEARAKQRESEQQNQSKVPKEEISRLGDADGFVGLWRTKCSKMLRTGGEVIKGLFYKLVRFGSWLHEWFDKEGKVYLKRGLKIALTFASLALRLSMQVVLSSLSLCYQNVKKLGRSRPKTIITPPKTIPSYSGYSRNRDFIDSSTRQAGRSENSGRLQPLAVRTTNVSRVSSTIRNGPSGNPGRPQPSRVQTTDVSDFSSKSIHTTNTLRVSSTSRDGRRGNSVRLQPSRVQMTNVSRVSSSRNGQSGNSGRP